MSQADDIKSINQKLDKLIESVVEYRVDQAVIKFQVKCLWGAGVTLLGSLVYAIPKIWNHVF